MVRGPTTGRVLPTHRTRLSPPRVSLTRRPHQVTEHFQSVGHAHLERNLRARLAWDSVNRWLGVRLEGLGATVVLCTALAAVYEKQEDWTSAARMLN